MHLYSLQIKGDSKKWLLDPLYHIQKKSYQSTNALDWQKTRQTGGMISDGMTFRELSTELFNLFP
jgi:hypothetical protein